MSVLEKYLLSVIILLLITIVHPYPLCPLDGSVDFTSVLPDTYTTCSGV